MGERLSPFVFQRVNDVLKIGPVEPERALRTHHPGHQVKLGRANRVAAR